jgi:hypothetical protein
MTNRRSRNLGHSLRCAVAAGALLVLPTFAQVPSRPAGPPGASATSQPLSRDEQLWREIGRLKEQLQATPPFGAEAAAALQLRRTLLEHARLYLTVYPGGTHRNQVVRLELETLFEIETLSGGSYDALCQRVDHYLERPPSESGLHEAAYWAIYCRRLGRSAAASQPASAPVAKCDRALLEAYREYVRRYPRSRHVPRMATLLFESAAERADMDEMRRLVAQLRRDFAGHAVTQLLEAQLRREEAIGRPFALAFKTAEGQQIDTAEWQGRPVLIVVWAGFSRHARAVVRQIEAFRQAHPALRVVGVNLDESAQRMHAACEELGVAWPQFNDGRGWANRVALRWGVRDVPWVFAVDRRGVLVGCRGEGWRALAAAALEN